MLNFVARVGWTGSEEYTPGVLYAITPSGPAYSTEAATVAAIIAESAKAANDAGGRPLPLAGNWHRANLPLSWQLTQIGNGHALLPWIAYNNKTLTATFEAYEADLQSLDTHGLPLTLIDDTNTFAEFANNAYFQALGVDDTGLAKSGTSKLLYNGTTYYTSPYSPDAPWVVLGQLQTDTAGCAYLESVVTAPPRVLHIPNNENDNPGRRMVSLYGQPAESDDNFWLHVNQTTYNAADADAKQQMRFDAAHYGWKAKFAHLAEGELAGLATSNWSAAYQTGTYWPYGDAYYNNPDWGGGGWHPMVSTGVDTGEVDSVWHSFGSASIELYDGYNAGSAFVGFNLNCINPRAMNLVFQRDYAYTANPDFWFEVIIWDGEVPSEQHYSALETMGNAKSDAYTAAGITYDENIYKGWLQYLLWIVQPRSLREFRYSNGNPDAEYTRTDGTYLAFGPYFDALINAVDHVHQNETLTRFWREGTLVKNQTLYGTRCGNPLNWHADGDFGLTDRWHHLATDIDCGFWAQGTIDWVQDHWKDENWQQPVWTLAHVIGTTPNREWLIYAHSTGFDGATLSDVVVTIPDYDDVTLPSVGVAGNFYYVKE